LGLAPAGFDAAGLARLLGLLAIGVGLGCAAPVAGSTAGLVGRGLISAELFLVAGRFLAGDFGGGASVPSCIGATVEVAGVVEAFGAGFFAGGCFLGASALAAGLAGWVGLSLSSVMVCQLI
jgi:hypothetical protein